jgi:hypothetical protein
MEQFETAAKVCKGIDMTLEDESGRRAFGNQVASPWLGPDEMGPEGIGASRTDFKRT